MAKLGTKPNGIFFLDVHVEIDGKLKRQRVSCDTRDRQEADKQRREWIAGVHPKHPAMGGSVAPKGRAAALLASSSSPVRVDGWTVERLLDRCLRDPEVWGKSRSQATLRSNIKFLCQHMGGELIETITRKRLRELKEELQEDLAPATIKRKMDTLSRALTQAAGEYELLPAKPLFPTISFDNRKKRVLSHEEELLVFAAIDARVQKEPSRQWARFRMFIRVLLDTGFRKGEALILGPSSIAMVAVPGQGRKPYLSLPLGETKNGEPRMVPATQAIIDLFPALDAQAVGGRWFPLGGNAWYMWDNIRGDVKAMGGDIDEVGLHTLRHTCITRLALGGMELQRLSIWAGHSDVSITAKRYSHLMSSALYAGVEALAYNPAAAANQAHDPETTGFSNYSISSGKCDNHGTARLQ